MRYNDTRDGTDVVSSVLQKYSAALEKKNMVSRDDLFQDWVSIKQGHTATAKSIGLTAWYVLLLISFSFIVIIMLNRKWLDTGPVRL